MTIRMKRYLARDMRTALKQVRLEQGADAVILSTQTLPEGVEVCAAADMEEAQALLAETRAQAEAEAARTAAAAAATATTTTRVSVAAPIATPVPIAPTAAAIVDTSAQDVSAELRSLRRLLEQQLATLSWNDFSRREPERVRVVDELQLLGVARATAVRLMERFPLPVGRSWGTADVAAWLSQELAVAPLPGSAGGVVALVGPAGAGKSTTLAKLAVREVLQHGAAGLALVCADTARLGAAEQTQALGRILGATAHSIVEADELAALWPVLQRKRLVLIDTGGVANRDAAAMQQLTQLLAVLPRTQPVLALPASTQDAVLRECIAAWRGCAGLTALLTRLDETTAPGAAIAELIEARVPLCGLSDGPRIPEDLAAADLATLSARLLAAVPMTIRNSTGEQQHAA